MRIIHDYYNRNDPSTIYLATPNKDILCALNSIDATSVDFVGKCNDLSTLTFTINRYTENSKGNRIEANGYELVSKYMRLYVTTEIQTLHSVSFFISQKNIYFTQ